eukprot:scaffold8799_cov30-Tisochrysis_lutea.AAC.2
MSSVVEGAADRPKGSKRSTQRSEPHRSCSLTIPTREKSFSGSACCPPSSRTSQPVYRSTAPTLLAMPSSSAVGMGARGGRGGSPVLYVAQATGGSISRTIARATTVSWPQLLRLTSSPANARTMTRSNMSCAGQSSNLPSSSLSASTPCRLDPKTASRAVNDLTGQFARSPPMEESDCVDRSLGSAPLATSTCELPVRSAYISSTIGICTLRQRSATKRCECGLLSERTNRERTSSWRRTSLSLASRSPICARNLHAPHASAVARGAAQVSGRDRCRLPPTHTHPAAAALSSTILRWRAMSSPASSSRPGGETSASRLPSCPTAPARWLRLSAPSRLTSRLSRRPPSRDRVMEDA